MVRARDVPLRISGGRARDYSVSLTKRWPTATCSMCVFVVMYIRFLPCIFIAMSAQSGVECVGVCGERERERTERRVREEEIDQRDTEIQRYRERKER